MTQATYRKNWVSQRNSGLREENMSTYYPSGNVHCQQGCVEGSQHVLRHSLKASGNPKTWWAGWPFSLPADKVTSLHLACGYVLNLPAPASVYVQGVGVCLAAAGVHRRWDWEGWSLNEGAAPRRRFYWQQYFNCIFCWLKMLFLWYLLKIETAS